MQNGSSWFAELSGLKGHGKCRYEEFKRHRCSESFNSAAGAIFVVTRPIIISCWLAAVAPVFEGGEANGSRRNGYESKTVLPRFLVETIIVLSRSPAHMIIPKDLHPVRSGLEHVYEQQPNSREHRPIYTFKANVGMGMIKNGLDHGGVWKAGAGSSFSFSKSLYWSEPAAPNWCNLHIRGHSQRNIHR